MNIQSQAVRTYAKLSLYRHVGKSGSINMAAMDEEGIVVAGITLGFMAIAGAASALSKKEVKRSVWVKPWILQRSVQGAYSALFQ